MYIPESTMEVVNENDVGMVLKWTYGNKERFVLALISKDNDKTRFMKFVASGPLDEVRNVLNETITQPGTDARLIELRSQF